MVLREHLTTNMALSRVVWSRDRPFVALLFSRPQLGEASRVAPMDKLSVLFAIILAAVVLRENVTWHHWLGGGLVLTGAVVLALK